MNRISARLATAVAGVRCPACSKTVLPVEVPAVAEEAGGDSGGERRWSFLWRAPSGPVCPECSFPLGRYARRVKWIRLLLTGIALATVFLLLLVFGMVSGGSSGRLLRQVTGLGGLAAILVGLGGVILGGRRQDK